MYVFSINVKHFVFVLLDVFKISNEPVISGSYKTIESRNISQRLAGLLYILFSEQIITNSISVLYWLELNKNSPVVSYHLISCYILKW